MKRHGLERSRSRSSGLERRASYAALAVAFVALAGCGRENLTAPPSPHASAAHAGTASSAAALGSTASAPSTSSSAGSSGAAAVAAASFTLPEIPLGVAPTPGPLRVEGYPGKLSAGMSDPASSFGFTRDGSKFVYCEYDVCCAEDRSVCTLIEAGGRTTQLMTPNGYAWLEGKEKAAATSRTKAELQRFAREEGLSEVGPMRDMMKSPPPVTGTFAFGGDMVLVVREIAMSEGKKDDGSDQVPGSVRIGARVAGEEPVFVVFPRSELCVKQPGICYEAGLNGLSVSRDGSELGFLVYIRNPSHGSTFAPARISSASFAALVFNDTGMRHHAKKGYARAVELFTRAVYADPSAERFAYNLACALARQGDARARHALRHAVSRGGDAVRARAKKDADFEGVRGETWFEESLR